MIQSSMLNMNEANQGYLPEASAPVPAKRKRGRPRKYPRTDVDQVDSVYIPRIQNLSHRQNAHIPTGTVGANGNQHHQADPASHSSDSIIGQLVHGVVEAAFDAGYLLNVRVGNSDTMLRGVVFKPGRYVPLSAANDVAPGVPMIRRNEVPVPPGNYAQNAYPWTGERSRTSQVARATNPVASASKQTYNADVHLVPSGSQRGNLVPVVLQPVNATNGMIASTQFASQMGASKGKGVLHGVNLQNGATSMNQGLPFQPQSNQQVLASGLPSGSVPFNHNPVEGLHGVASKPMAALPTMPFETLLTEVMKRVQVPSQSMETNSSSADKLSAKDPEGDAEDDDDDDGSDSDQALSVEPLQAVQPGFPVPPLVVSRPPGKLTELLQALQENIAEKQDARSKEQAAGSSQN